MSTSSVKPDNSSNSKSAAERFMAMDAADKAAAMADAKGWEPKDGDELRGLVIGIKSGVSEYKEKAGRNPNYPILFVLPDDSDDVVGVHCFQTVLENEIRSARPLPGESIYIKRIGEGKKKPGQSAVIRYAVHVERETGSTDPWEHMQ